MNKTHRCLLLRLRLQQTLSCCVLFCFFPSRRSSGWWTSLTSNQSAGLRQQPCSGRCFDCIVGWTPAFIWPRIGVSRVQCSSEQDRDSAAGIRARAGVVFVSRDGYIFRFKADGRDSVCFGLTFCVGFVHAWLQRAGLALSLWDKWCLTRTALVLIVLTELRTEKRLFILLHLLLDLRLLANNSTVPSHKYQVNNGLFKLISNEKLHYFGTEWTLVRSFECLFWHGLLS